MATPNAAGLTANRLEALSDGIFAIVLTLIALELKTPAVSVGASSREVHTALLQLLPQMVCYVMAFVSAGTLWVAHRALFHFVVRTDRTFLWINLSFFLFVTLIPFLTSVVLQLPRYPMPVVLYGLNLIISVMILYGMWRYAAERKHLVSAAMNLELKRAVGRRILIGPCVYLVALAFSFLNTWISIFLYVLVPIAYAMPGKVDLHWHSDRSESTQ